MSNKHNQRQGGGMVGHCDLLYWTKGMVGRDVGEAFEKKVPFFRSLYLKACLSSLLSVLLI